MEDENKFNKQNNRNQINPWFTNFLQLKLLEQ